MIVYTEPRHSLNHAHRRARQAIAQPEFFNWAGRKFDFEAIYNLWLIIRIMLQKSCCKRNCNT